MSYPAYVAVPGSHITAPHPNMSATHHQSHARSVTFEKNGCAAGLARLGPVMQAKACYTLLCLCTLIAEGQFASQTIWLVERSVLRALTTVVSSVSEAIAEVEHEASIAAPKARRCRLSASFSRSFSSPNFPVLHSFQPATLRAGTHVSVLTH